jgi:hypothetical protein
VDIKSLISTLNEKYNYGFLDRGRVFVGGLGYFGITENLRCGERYFATTFFRGIAPQRYKHVEIEWYEEEFNWGAVASLK